MFFTPNSTPSCSHRFGTPLHSSRLPSSHSTTNISRISATISGLYRDAEEACRKMVRVKSMFEPDPGTAGRYEESCRRYTRMYPCEQVGRTGYAGICQLRGRLPMIRCGAAWKKGCVPDILMWSRRNLRKSWRRECPRRQRSQCKTVCSKGPCAGRLVWALRRGHIGQAAGNGHQPCPGYHAASGLRAVRIGQCP
jgi:hypothetical protein